jgi:hypothetical protein
MVIMNTFEAAAIRSTVQLDDLKLAEVSGLRAVEIVSELMLYTRSGASPDQETGPESVDLHSLVSSVIDIGIRTFDPGVVIQDMLPEHLPEIQG